MQDINQRILENSEELNSKFEQVFQEFALLNTLLLDVSEEREVDIRDQFRYDKRYTHFQGRVHAIDILTSFLMDERPFCFYAISGPGGSGKSRLAYELCIRAKKTRWISGFCKEPKNRQFNWTAFRPEAPTLIVLDYVLGRKKEVAEILETLSSLSTNGKFDKHKLRVVLLERNFDEDLKRTLITSETRRHYYNYELDKEETPYRLTTLEDDARWQIIEQLVMESDEPGRADNIIAQKEIIVQELDKQDPEKRPLFAFFTGIALKEGETVDDITGWNTNDNLSYHLDRLEKRVWSQIDLWQDSNIRTTLKNVIWLAAISEYLSYDDLEVIKDLAPFERLTTRWGEESFWDQLRMLFLMEAKSTRNKVDLPGMKPDLLAEYYISSHITTMQQNPALEKQLLALYKCAWHIRPEGVWWMSWLTFSNYLDDKKLKLSHYEDWLSDLRMEGSAAIFVGLTLFNLALFYEGRGKPELAEKYYLAAIEKGDVLALNNLALLYQDQGKPELAAKYYLEAIGKGVVSAFYNLALIYQKQGKPELAEKYYLAAIDKGHVSALYNLALLHQDQGKPELAEKYYLAAIEKGNVLALNNLALLHQDQGKPDLAEKYYLAAIEKRDVSALYNLALLYKDQGKPDLAEKYYLEAINKGHVSALYNLALLYQDQGKPELAEKYYLAAIEKGGVPALYNLALIYQKQGKPELAEKYYLAAIEKGDVLALNNLALLYQDQGKPDLAKKYYLEAIDKGHVSALNNLALHYKDQGKPELAEKYYLAAIEKGDVPAINNLASLYWNGNKNKQDAWQLINSYLKAGNNLLKNRLFQLIISVWAEETDFYLKHRKKVLTDVLKQQTDLFPSYMLLLYHDHSDFLLQEFEEGDHSEYLQQEQLFYYLVVLHFFRPNDARLKDIPEEMRPVFNQVVAEIEQKRTFYGRSV